MMNSFTLNESSIEILLFQSFDYQHTLKYINKQTQECIYYRIPLIDSSKLLLNIWYSSIYFATDKYFILEKSIQYIINNNIAMYSHIEYNKYNPVVEAERNVSLYIYFNIINTSLLLQLV